MREADITLGDADLTEIGIDELVELGQAAGIRHLEELACRGTGAIVQVEVDERYDEARLDELAYVEHWEYLTKRNGGHVYIIAFEAPGLPAELADRADAMLGTCDPDLDTTGTTMHLTGNQTDIAELIAAYERAGVSPDLGRLGGYAGVDTPMAGLTDRQREVIETAHRMGYYEVPRRVSTADIAEALDLDPSTITEHLQRAERNLLDDIL